MSTTKFGGTGHGMPEPLPRDVEKQLQAKEAEKRKKQAEEFAKDSLPIKGTTTTTIHESKHFPFQIIEIQTTNAEDKQLSKIYKVGAMGAFMSEKTFTRKCDAEKYISSRPWELITNIMCLTIQNAIEYEKSKS